MNKRPFVFELLLVCGFILTSTSCTQDASLPDAKLLLVQASCEDTESASDLEYGLSKLHEFFDTSGIVVSWPDSSIECGYLLKWGKKSQAVNHIMTDVDLMELCQEFYDLK